MATNENFQIDEMNIADLPRVLVLSEQLGYPGNIADFRRRFQLLKKLPDQKLLVARNKSNQILGWVHVGQERSSLLSDDRAEIGALVVDRKFRSQGIGTCLIKAAEKWAKEKNLEMMRVRSNVKRSDAHRFYQRQGYEIVKSWHLFSKSL